MAVDPGRVALQRPELLLVERRGRGREVSRCEERYAHRLVLRPSSSSFSFAANVLETLDELLTAVWGWLLLR